MGFYGREEEVKWLRGLWDECTSGQGPRIAMVIADTGVGKSRLVQELYRQLVRDPRWDPPELSYWPDEFQPAGPQMRVNAVLDGHAPNGPPRFLWLGMRWQPPDTRNVEERACAIPEARDALRAHVRVAERLGTAWQDLLTSGYRAVKCDAVKEGIGQAADWMMPYGGLILKLGVGVTKKVNDRRSGVRSVSGEREKQRGDAADELVSELREVLAGKGGLPTILWLDDSQWIDKTTLTFLEMLWGAATKGNWPLLVVATHWEREWNELVPHGTGAQSLSDYRDKPGVATRHLGRGAAADLRACAMARCPGLKATQLDSLVQKAGGNFLSMEENLGELVGNRLYFEGGDASRELTPAGEALIGKFEGERTRRVAQRFKALSEEVQRLLGWGSEQGTRFLWQVVVAYGNQKHPEGSHKGSLGNCSDPLALLGNPSPFTREFRDKAFFHAAQEYFGDFCADDRIGLQLALQKQLGESINSSFDDKGDLLSSNAHDSSKLQADPRQPVSAVSMPSEERRDLLGMAEHSLSIPSPADWTNPTHMAWLRTRILATQQDAADHLHERVIRHGRCCEQVTWADVPECVVSRACRRAAVLAWSVAGAPAAALACANDIVDRARAAAGQEQSVATRRELMASLLLVGQLEYIDKQYNSAGKKYSEALTIARELHANLPTPQSQADLDEARKARVSCAIESRDMVVVRSWTDELLTDCRVPPPTHREPDAVDPPPDDIAAAEATMDDVEERFHKRFFIGLRLEQLVSRLPNPTATIVALERSADFENSNGRFDSAIEKYEQCLERVSQHFDSSTTLAERWDSVLCRRVMAMIANLRGQFARELNCLRESLALARALIALDTNPERQLEVQSLLEGIAIIEWNQDEQAAAVVKVQESLLIARGLEALTGTRERRLVVLRLSGWVGYWLACRNEISAALAITCDAHLLADVLSGEPQPDREALEEAARLWAITAFCLEELGRDSEAEDATAKAEAIRLRIPDS